MRFLQDDGEDDGAAEEEELPQDLRLADISITMNVIIGIVGFLMLIGFIMCCFAYKEFRRAEPTTDDEKED